MYSKDQSQEPKTTRRSEGTKDLREANENVRKSQGDDATGPVNNKKSGNKPAFDRDR